MTTLDVAAIISRFPSLRRSDGDGIPYIYADAPGGTQCPDDVIDAMASYLRRSNANEGGAFVTSEETGTVVAAARSAMADFLACEQDEIVFGANMTTLAFHLAHSLTLELSPGDDVIVTRLDHDANVEPWAAAARDSGATLRKVDLDPDTCGLDRESLDEALSGNPKIVAFTLASNAVGTVTPAAEIARRARALGALVIADAVHFAPHHLIDVAALDVDVLFCSPYKFFGPHAGVMYARRTLLESLRPYKVRPASDLVPMRWETGTKNHEALAGITAAVDYLASLGGAGSTSRRENLARAYDAVAQHEETLSETFLDRVGGVPGCMLYGSKDPSPGVRTPTFALRLDGRAPRDVAAALGRAGAFVWSGNYYALETMEGLGLEATGGAVRIGFCHYHTVEQAERIAQLLGDVD